ncbi:MAG: peptidoglycan-binding protein [Rhodospirillales bacterium]|nr:peptidoglycan-binding protein [Rhodospirillales bacterium]
MTLNFQRLAVWAGRVALLFIMVTGPGWADLSPAFAARGDIPDTRINEFSDPEEIVHLAQQSLKRLKYYDGPIDGRMSQMVIDAIKDYQSTLGRPVDGKLTTELAQQMETQGKVGDMLARLQEVRRTKIDQARRALMGKSETRGFLDNAAENETADPTRDVSSCFKSPTEQCLLIEAVESAKGIFKTELRDWAYGEILVSQAKAGLLKSAVATVRRIGDARLILVALRDIARAQAKEGRISEALDTAKIIPTLFKRLEALTSVAEIRMERGDREGAADTARRIIALSQKLEHPLQQVTVLTQMAVILSKVGEKENSMAAIASAEKVARTTTASDAFGKIEKGAAIRHIASAYAVLGNSARALDMIEKVVGDYDRIAVLMSVAKALAAAGQTDAALMVAGKIDTDRYRSVMLGRIAAEMSRKGEMDKAFVLVKYALSKAENIELPYAKSYATGQIVLSLIQIGQNGGKGAFKRAAEIAEQIENDRLRAYAFWSIASAQSRMGMVEASRQTERMARRATDAIGSALSQVWMLSDVATELWRSGDKKQARRAFDEATEIARTIGNAWGRARALAKLAAALHDIR